MNPGSTPSSPPAPPPRVLAVITARGGSKGLPGKNLLEAHGRPLVAWTIQAALQANCVTRTIMSSDDPRIMQAAREWGCEVPFTRPAELATDEAASIDVVLHALEQCPGHEYVVLLQPTSPLRSAADIDAAFALLRAQAAPACVSVCPVLEPPQWMYRLDASRRLQSLLGDQPQPTRRQALAPVQILNGAVYVAETAWLTRERRFVTPHTVGYGMPRERSLDIDSEADFRVFADGPPPPTGFSEGAPAVTAPAPARR